MADFHAATYTPEVTGPTSIPLLPETQEVFPVNRVKVVHLGETWVVFNIFISDILGNNFRYEVECGS